MRRSNHLPRHRGDEFRRDLRRYHSIQDDRFRRRRERGRDGVGKVYGTRRFHAACQVGTIIQKGIARCAAITEEQRYASSTNYSQQRQNTNAYPDCFHVHVITSTLILAIQERRPGCPLAAVPVDIVRPTSITGKGCCIRGRRLRILRRHKPCRGDRLGGPCADHPVYKGRSPV